VQLPGSLPGLRLQDGPAEVEAGYGLGPRGNVPVLQDFIGERLEPAELLLLLQPRHLVLTWVPPVHEQRLDLDTETGGYHLQVLAGWPGPACLPALQSLLGDDAGRQLGEGQAPVDAGLPEHVRLDPDTSSRTSPGSRHPGRS
jgi:hypothetical protein